MPIIKRVSAILSLKAVVIGNFGPLTATFAEILLSSANEIIEEKLAELGKPVGVKGWFCALQNT